MYDPPLTIAFFEDRGAEAPAFYFSRSHFGCERVFKRRPRCLAIHLDLHIRKSVFRFFEFFQLWGEMAIAVISPTIISVSAFEDGDIFAISPDLIECREIALFDRQRLACHDVRHGLYFVSLCRNTLVEAKGDSARADNDGQRGHQQSIKIFSRHKFFSSF